MPENQKSVKIAADKLNESVRPSNLSDGDDPERSQEVPLSGRLYLPLAVFSKYAHRRVSSEAAARKKPIDILPGLSRWMLLARLRLNRA